MMGTTSELYDWLESEGNRDRLLTKNSKLEGPVFRVADKTADYFRKLVGHWDAVAVDSGIKGLLAKTGVMLRYSTKWSYKEKRSIVQLAALNLDCTPRDLDTSIYRYCVSTKASNRKTKGQITTSHPNGYSGHQTKSYRCCLGCGEKIPQHAKYCPECGIQQL